MLMTVIMRRVTSLQLEIGQVFVSRSVSIRRQDSPLGVRFADYVTAFPAGINAAATYALLPPPLRNNIYFF